MLPQHEAPASSEPEGVAVPDHELIQCIGRGSYGEVWLARNLMGTYRAVKVVYRKNFGHQRPYDRELAGIKKFEPISRSHESFVNILHVGQNVTGGYFYYIMELGDDLTTGQNINPRFYVPKTVAKQVALRGRLPLNECVQLGLSLSAALDSLHTHGLVHRDVKPSNIIFVNGVPKLADLGLVADINEARSYVGTEGFIPPEGPGTAQADVYSLGKVLYEIGTGKDRQDFPELPHDLQERPDKPEFLQLNQVILKACETDPRQRYATAAMLRTDLERLQQGKPPELRETTPNNLPASLTSFIGREKEIAEAERLLKTARLLTFTGAGGCGKTRLALEVAGQSLNKFPDGVYLVELAPLSDANVVTQVMTS